MKIFFRNPARDNPGTIITDSPLTAVHYIDDPDAMSGSQRTFEHAPQYQIDPLCNQRFVNGMMVWFNEEEASFSRSIFNLIC